MKKIYFSFVDKKNQHNFVDNIFNSMMAFNLIGKRVQSVFAIMLVTLNLAASEIVFNGVFQEQNIYVKNPQCEGENNFSIKEILVNDKKYDVCVKTSLIVIDLSSLNLKIGEPYTLAISYNENCIPEIVNKQSLLPISTFDLISAEFAITADSSTVLNFITENETAPMTFFVEQFRRGEWKKMATIAGEGGKTQKKYTVPMTSLSGENKIRIYQTNEVGVRQRTKEISVVSGKQENVKLLKISQSKKKSEIQFSGITYYSIVNVENAIVLKEGVANIVDISDLPKAKYFLNFEDEYTVFKRK